jgi:hypothetical protein
VAAQLAAAAEAERAVEEAARRVADAERTAMEAAHAASKARALAAEVALAAAEAKRAADAEALQREEQRRLEQLMSPDQLLKETKKLSVVALKSELTRCAQNHSISLL